jgi:hypothetical protein
MKHNIMIRMVRAMDKMLMLVFTIVIPILMLAYPVNAYGIDAIILYAALISTWAFMLTSLAAMVSISVRGNVKSNHYHHTTLLMGRGFSWA